MNLINVELSMLFIPRFRKTEIIQLQNLSQNQGLVVPNTLINAAVNYLKKQVDSTLNQHLINHKCTAVFVFAQILL